MKKKYTAPQTTVVRVESESIMQASVHVKSYLDPSNSVSDEILNSRYSFKNNDILYWTGTEQPETAKDNGFSLWSDED